LAWHPHLYLNESKIVDPAPASGQVIMARAGLEIQLAPKVGAQTARRPWRSARRRDPDRR